MIYPNSMLFIYGTVYNSKNRVIQSLESVIRIKIEKSIYIVDNCSTDGTYDILEANRHKYNMQLKREKCTRGWGRHLAVEMAETFADPDDMFMFIDLDTVYNKTFCRLIEFAYRKIDKKTVFLDNQLSYTEANHNVPWKDLAAAEDVEREARFISSGYKLTYPEGKMKLWENEEVSYDREKRYARGLEYYKRKLRLAQDVLIGVGCNNARNLLFFMKNAKVRKRYYWTFTLIFIYVKIFKQIYNYSSDTNIELIRRKSKFIEIKA
jgi:glycosyltransferase involved in cell wall biosynthesis